MLSLTQARLQAVFPHSAGPGPTHVCVWRTGKKPARIRPIMDDVATAEKTTRRVGVAEGVRHMVGSALVFVLLAQPFVDGVALTVMAGAALAWALSYVTLRATRVRSWFGAWDTLSFVFVWSYAVVLALAAHIMVIRLG